MLIDSTPDDTSWVSSNDNGSNALAFAKKYFQYTLLSALAFMFSVVSPSVVKMWIGGKYVGTKGSCILTDFWGKGNI